MGLFLYPATLFCPIDLFYGTVSLPRYSILSHRPFPSSTPLVSGKQMKAHVKKAPLFSIFYQRMESEPNPPIYKKHPHSFGPNTRSRISETPSLSIRFSSVARKPGANSSHSASSLINSKLGSFVWIISLHF